MPVAGVGVSRILDCEEVGERAEKWDAGVERPGLESMVPILVTEEEREPWGVVERSREILGCKNGRMGLEGAPVAVDTTTVGMAVGYTKPDAEDAVGDICEEASAGYTRCVSKCVTM